jgi:hypothetical protein
MQHPCREALALCRERGIRDLESEGCLAPMPADGLSLSPQTRIRHRAALSGGRQGFLCSNLASSIQARGRNGAVRAMALGQTLRRLLARQSQ